MKALLRCVAFGAAIFASANAFAAESGAQLGAIRGSVLVSVSAGFVPASEGRQLKAGDRIMIAGEGSAVLRYDGGCSIPLTANSMTTVGESACVTATHDTGPNPASNDLSPPPAPSQPMAPLAVAAVPVVAAGATIGLMIGLDDNVDDDNEPVSP